MTVKIIDQRKIADQILKNFGRSNTIAAKVGILDTNTVFGRTVGSINLYHSLGRNASSVASEFGFDINEGDAYQFLKDVKVNFSFYRKPKNSKSIFGAGIYALRTRVKYNVYKEKEYVDNKGVKKKKRIFSHSKFVSLEKRFKREGLSLSSEYNFDYKFIHSPFDKWRLRLTRRLIYDAAYIMTGSLLPRKSVTILGNVLAGKMREEALRQGRTLLAKTIKVKILNGGKI